MKEFYSVSYSEVLRSLGSNEVTGLSEEQVLLRQKQRGISNIKPHSRTKLSMYMYNLYGIWVFISIACAGLSLYLKMPIITAAIMGQLFILLIIITQPYRRKNQLAAETEKYLPKKARVLRNGKILSVGVESLVIGDIVFINQGDIVPSDLRLIEEDKLKIKESVVTGEVFIVEKHITRIEEEDINLSDMVNIVFKGSRVTAGEGAGVVIATGADCQIDRLLEILKSNNNKDEKKLTCEIKTAYNILMGFNLIVILIYLIEKIMMENGYTMYLTPLDFTNNLPFTLWIFLIPLLATILCYIALLIFRASLKKREIELRDFSSVGNLCSSKVFFAPMFDFTMEENFEVVDMYTNGELLALKNKIDFSIENTRRVFHIAVHSSDKDKGKTVDKYLDLMELEILRYAEEKLPNLLQQRVREPMVFSIPFDRVRRIKTMVNYMSGNYRANSKGALETLLPLCSFIMKDGLEKEITNEDLEAIRNADFKMKSRGLHTLGFAYRNFTYKPTPQENVESNLVFVGLLGFINPIKEDVKLSLEELRSKGNEMIFFTEENKLSALVKAQNLGIINSVTQALSGVELQYAGGADFKSISKVYLYSRLDNHMRQWVVSSWREQKNVPMVFGRRFVDLPILKEASVAIAFGEDTNILIKKYAHIYIPRAGIGEIINLKKNIEQALQRVRKFIAFEIYSSIADIIYIAALNIFFEKNSIDFSTFSIGKLVLHIVFILMLFMDLWKDKKEDTASAKDNSYLFFNKNCFFTMFSALAAAVIAQIALLASNYMNLPGSISIFTFLGIQFLTGLYYRIRGV